MTQQKRPVDKKGVAIVLLVILCAGIGISGWRVQSITISNGGDFITLGTLNVQYLNVNSTSIQELVQSIVQSMGYIQNTTPPAPPVTPPSEPAPPHYTVKFSSPNYITKDPAGTTLYSGTSATTAVQTGLNDVTAGQMLDLQGITYPITAQLTLSKNNVYIHGNTSCILQFSSAVTGYCILYSGTAGSHYSDTVFDGVTFDLNNYSGAVRVKWVDNATFINCHWQDTKTTGTPTFLDFGGDSASSANRLYVSDCTFTNAYGSAITNMYATNIVVQNSTFTNFCQFYPSGGAVHADDGCSNILIQNNVMTSTGTLNDGVYIGTSRSFITGAVVRNNTMTLSGPGSDSAHAGSGIKAYATGGSFTDNHIDWADTPYEVGIGLFGSGNTVTGNVISNVRWGIASWSGYTTSAQHTIQYNTITSSVQGIHLENDDSTANHQTYSGNGSDVVDSGSGNITTPNP